MKMKNLIKRKLYQTQFIIQITQKSKMFYNSIISRQISIINQITKLFICICILCKFHGSIKKKNKWDKKRNGTPKLVPSVRVGVLEKPKYRQKQIDAISYL